MSFEVRSEEEDVHRVNDENGSDTSSGVFHTDEQHILISSTNDVALFPDSPHYKTLPTLGVSLLMMLATVRTRITQDNVH